MVARKAQKTMLDLSMDAIPQGVRSFIGSAPPRPSGQAVSANLRGGEGWSAGAKIDSNTMPFADNRWGGPSLQVNSSIGDSWGAGAPTSIDAAQNWAARRQQVLASPHSSPAARERYSPSTFPGQTRGVGGVLGQNIRAKGVAPPRRSPARAPVADPMHGPMPRPPTMPTPSGPRRGASQASKSVASGPSANHGFGGWSGASAASMGATFLGGGVMGGVASYGTGGSFSQGFAAGGMGGLGMRYALRNRHAAAGLGESMIGHMGGKGANNYSGKLTELASQMNDRNARATMIGSGALLTGFAFGGDRSHKRGFNSHRGNSIGR